MSNILKKITKKYKWLRFLNYKTTKLAVLSAALFGLCLSSGASFAKYRDENYGGGNAGAAKFGGEIVSFDYKTYSIEKISAQYYGTYAFVAEFSIDFSNFEASFNYDISLKITANDSDIWSSNNPVNGTSFSYKTGNLYTLDANFKPTNNVSGLLTESMKINTNYAYASNADGWNSSSSSDWLSYNSESDVVTLTGSISVNESDKIVEYKILYFVYIAVEDATEISESYILYNLNTIQIGGNQ